MPVLEGAGGLRKSTGWRRPAPEFYSDTKFDIGHGHDGQEQVQGIWLYEVAELAGMSKSEVADIKAFVRRRKSPLRLLEDSPTHPRASVLVAPPMKTPICATVLVIDGFGRRLCAMSSTPSGWRSTATSCWPRLMRAVSAG